MQRRQRKTVLVFVTLLAVLAAACGGQPADEPAAGGTNGAAEPAGGDGEVFEMEITVTHFPTLLYAVPYLVGIEEGYFEEEGIRITGISGSEGGGTTVRNVLTGGLPFGEVATPAAANAYLAGAPIVAVGGGVQSVAEINWVAMADAGMEGIEDVVGKSVGYTSPGSVTQGTLNLSLNRAGVDLGEVDDRAMGGIGEGLTALQGGGIDAASNLEPVYSGEPDPYKVLWWASDYIPDFQQTVIITSPEMIDANPDVVEGFLAARARGIEFVEKNPEEAAAIWAAEADLDEQVALSSLEQVLPDDYYGVGFNQEGLVAVDEEMHLIELVEEGVEISWDEIVNQDFLPDGVDEIDPAAVGGG